MLTRAEAVEILDDLLNDPHMVLVHRKNAFHFGLAELRTFLDALYGGPPKEEAEELHNSVNGRRRREW